MDGGIDYSQLERPAVIRKQAQGTSTTSSTTSHNISTDSTSTSALPDIDFLDIPAFLRKQEG
jgi:cell division protein FtsZ